MQARPLDGVPQHQRQELVGHRKSIAINPLGQRTKCSTSVLRAFDHAVSAVRRIRLATPKRHVVGTGLWSTLASGSGCADYLPVTIFLSWTVNELIAHLAAGVSAEHRSPALVSSSGGLLVTGLKSRSVQEFNYLHKLPLGRDR